MTKQITTQLIPPDPSLGRERFEAQGDAFAHAMGAVATEANEMAVEMNANATTAAEKAAEADVSATTASNAAEAALAAKLASASSWVSGAAYVKDDVRWGPDGALYRCTAPVSGSATPPAGDAAHWARALINPTDLAALVLRVAANETAVNALRDVPTVTKTGAYTLKLDDRGCCVRANAAVTIPANASVAFPVGTTIIVRNISGAAISIGINADELRLAGTSKIGPRTLAAFGSATLHKDDEDTWFCSGIGLT